MTPFSDALPEGVTWAEVTDQDRQWVANTSGTQMSLSWGCIRIEVHIRRTIDGEVRVHVDSWYPFDASKTSIQGLQRDILWQWTGGNYGCDCNRGLFFAGEGDPEVACGSGAYQVVSPPWMADATAVKSEGK